MASFAPTQGQGPWEAELEAGMRGMFSSAEALARIPSLNATPVEQLRPGTLVRYRCMVQDVQDPEFYPGWRCGAKMVQRRMQRRNCEKYVNQNAFGGGIRHHWLSCVRCL